MADARYDVVGIGNAIVDIIGRCDEALLAKIGAQKGSMRLVDADEITRLYAEMGAGVEISGGSAANTIAGIASFGGRAAFIGTVANDEFGKIFTHDIRSIGVTFTAPLVVRHRTDISFAYSRNARRRTHDAYVSRNIDQPRRKTARSRIDTQQRHTLSRRLSFRRTRCEAIISPGGANCKKRRPQSRVIAFRWLLRRQASS